MSINIEIHCEGCGGMVGDTDLEKIMRLGWMPKMTFGPAEGHVLTEFRKDPESGKPAKERPYEPRQGELCHNCRKLVESIFEGKAAVVSKLMQGSRDVEGLQAKVCKVESLDWTREKGGVHAEIVAFHNQLQGRAYGDKTEWTFQELIEQAFRCLRMVPDDFIPSLPEGASLEDTVGQWLVGEAPTKETQRAVRRLLSKRCRALLDQHWKKLLEKSTSSE